MRERDALRTAEAWLEEYDLRDMRPQDELTAEEWAKEFRSCLYFAVICGAGLLAFQFLWSV